ncbi:DUF3109 family protein [Thermophagus xiamenensis]|uniref:DUF3109 family protein n=1 Tax=Thermophagus xiamenensis TaxID=385682 RepID=A0A1I2F9T0_9BACT|nr:DUF3109 family protein [Thermophagus xiamenensis]SFF02102.1 Protein of unknown function [Thermophagus xiamenensis]
MVQIDDKIISLDIFEKHFVCDLPHCLGSCCVEGESGAPLEDDETEILDKIFPLIRHLLSPEAIDIIEKNGTWEVDADGDKVTPIIRGRECVYTYFDQDGVCRCAIEKAHREGLIDFKKPISCHLYPIRVDKYENYEALNYHVWPVCNPARELGEKLGVPVFRFLKEPIIRKYGKRFYDEMEDVYKHLEKQKANQGNKHE